MEDASDDIAIDTLGNVYVTPAGNHTLHKFKLASPCPPGTTQVAIGVCFVKKWGTFGTGNGQFNIPVGLAVDASGRVYVADDVNHRIQLFKATGTFIIKWGKFGSGDGDFKFPVGVALDISGNVYVTDAGNNRIQKFKLANPCPPGTKQVATGVCFVTKWGSPGSGNGQFNGPMDIDVDSSGIVYVVDINNNRIQMFTSNGIFIKTWGLLGSGNAQFTAPIGLTVDSVGHVYVTEIGNSRVQKFLVTPNPCPAGTTQITTNICFVTKWGTLGSSNGQLWGPGGIAVDASGRVYVVETTNMRVQVFTWLPDVGGTGGAGGGTSPNIAIK